jgi:hypothetical protein
MGLGKYEVYVGTEASVYLRNRGWLKDKWANKPSSSKYGRFYDLIMPFTEDSPPQLITLSEGLDGTSWLIDTDQGTYDIHVHLYVLKARLGMIYPVEAHIVDSTAQGHQPWRRCAKPRDIQEYFDELYVEIETLVTVPVPLSRGNGCYHEILPSKWENGGVSFTVVAEALETFAHRQ